jgi:hypothetical protein
MGNSKKDEAYSEEEARRRAETALRAAFNAPHKPQSEMKLGKSSAKPKKSLISQATKTPGTMENERPSRQSPVIDIRGVSQRLALLLRDAEPRILEDLFKLIAELPRNLLASFFGNFFKPAYVAVNGTTQHIAELHFVLPGGADELLTALRTYEADRNKIFAHGSIPYAFREPNAKK